MEVYGETESSLEKKLGDAMNAHPLLVFQFSSQVWIGPYRVDFGFERARIAVEADGENYHRDRKQEDQERDADLAARDWRVLRFTDKQIVRDMPGVLLAIVRALYVANTVTPKLP